MKMNLQLLCYAICSVNNHYILNDYILHNLELLNML